MSLRSPVSCLFPAFPVMTQADAYCAITGLPGGKSVVKVPVKNAGTFKAVATGREGCAIHGQRPGHDVCPRPPSLEG